MSVTPSPQSGSRARPSRRLWRVLLAASLVLVVVIAGVPARAGAGQPEPGQAGVQGAVTAGGVGEGAIVAGANWLATQINAEGFATSAFTPGQPDPGITSDIALSLAAAGRGGDAFNRAVEWLRNPDNGEVVFGFGTDSVRPAAIGLLLLVGFAAGESNPGVIGEPDSEIDLVAALGGTIQGPGDDDHGLYGDGDPTFDGVYRQSLAILGLKAIEATVPDEAVTWLAGQQCDDGGFPFYREAGGDCDSDADATALAIQATVALDPAPANPDATKALDWLEDDLGANGAWTYFGTPSENSTANAIGAIVASGEDPTTGRWETASGATPVSWLASRQLQCPSVDVGAFVSEFSGGGPDLFASRQALLGITETSLPVEAANFNEAPAAPCAPVVSAVAPATGSVTVTVTQGAGGVPAEVTVVADPGNRSCVITPPTTSCEITGLSPTGTFTFTATAENATGTSTSSAPSVAVTPGAGSPETPFADVPPSSYYARGADMLVARGITTGWSGNPKEYNPVAVVDRAQMAAFLWRMAGSPATDPSCGFGDVPAGRYFSEAACWLKAEGITTGFAGNPAVYNPNGVVDRIQMATFLWRFVGRPATPTPCGFTDVPRNAFYEEPACWALASGVTTGWAGDPAVYRPVANVTRAQMAAFLYRTGGTQGLWVVA